MRDEAFRRIGHQYPKARLPGGGEATVIAWLWARTVPCPNPACGVEMPLVTSFQLSKKTKNQHWTRPVVDRESRKVSFVVQNNDEDIPLERTVIPGGKGALCVACQGTVTHGYIRDQARGGNMGEVMTAIVAEGVRKRLFLSPTEEHVRCAREATPGWRPNGNLPDKARSISVQIYGFTQWNNLHTDRQLSAMTKFGDQLEAVRGLLEQDGASREYADTVATYLSIASGKYADYCSNFCSWILSSENVSHVFTGQGIGMMWDYAEANPFSNLAQNWLAGAERVAKSVERLSAGVNIGLAHQADASTTIHANNGPIIVTDPPYYGSIHYADSSDFFYVWLRPLLRDIFADLFAGMLTPKSEEMIANQFRFENPRDRFEHLLGETLQLIRQRCSPEMPSSIFYAYKQQEEQKEGRASTGWETMLTALVNAGFMIVGTWPMRTERAARSHALSANSLASSVVLVCRPRPDDAPVGTRRQFLDTLARDLPDALDHLTRESHIAPVDLAQAAIGPGMEIYSQFSRVETLGGERVSIRDALVQINRVVDEYHEAQEGEIDSESRFCVEWLKGHGFLEGTYGEAELLSKARVVAIESAPLNGLLRAEAGQVKLRRMDDFGADRPLSRGMTAWEGCMRMAWHLNREAGEGVDGASSVAREMAGLGAEVESVERLARILYNHFDRKSDSANAVAFNNVVTSWQDILTRMQQAQNPRLL